MNIDLTTLLCSLLSLLFGGGLSALLLLPQRKQTEKLNNEKLIVDMWKELVEKKERSNANLREELNRKSDLIDTLYEDLKTARRELNDATSEVATLKILKCNTISCAHRQPPMGTDYETT